MKQSRGFNSFSTIVRMILFMSLLAAGFSGAPVLPVQAGTAVDLVGPAGSVAFGANITILPNGNFVVIDSAFASGALAKVGAVYLFDGKTRALISTLTGSQANDQVGSDGITVLNNGNFVIRSRSWANGSPANAGAVTWCSAVTGCQGAVSATNSLVGSQANDQIGNNLDTDQYYDPLLKNSNYFVESLNWANGSAAQAGAVTWCSGDTGCQGSVSAINSLVGSQAGDQVGGVTMLDNGSFVVRSQHWANGPVSNAGAVTFCATVSSCLGAVSAANSLVGSHSGDMATFTFNNGPNIQSISHLPDSNYVVINPGWSNGSLAGAGAVTWCSGVTGCQGPVSGTNSLVGTQAGDNVGIGGIFWITQANYVVESFNWANGYAPAAGAATFCSSSSGCQGTVSAANSLVGSHTNDQVGYGDPSGGPNSGIVANLRHNYIVRSASWANGSAANAGAVTWCSGITGCVGAVSAANSLVGTQAGDRVGSISTDTNLYFNGVVSLLSEDYMVSSSEWANGSATRAGAVTWCSGGAGCQGAVSAANSLVGSQKDDRVGMMPSVQVNNAVGGIFPADVNYLNFVIVSSYWNYGSNVQAGAVTWYSGTTGCQGVVSATNSLVGTHAYDWAGYTFSGFYSPLSLLKNGAYVVTTSRWSDDTGTRVGAVTHCTGNNACHGAISAANSLIDTQPSGYGNSGWIVTPLTNGNYVVSNQGWASGALQKVGSVTWCSGTAGCVGLVTANHSLFGSQANDQVGRSLLALTNGNYVVSSGAWSNGNQSGAGAVTWCSGASGCQGNISAANSLVGSHAGDSVGGASYTPTVHELKSGNYVVNTPGWSNGSMANAGAVSFCSGITGCQGIVSGSNSLIGGHDSDMVSLASQLPNGNYLVSSKWSSATIANAGAVAWCSGASGCQGLVSGTNSLVGSHANDKVGSGGVTILNNSNYVVESPGWMNGSVPGAGAVTWCSGASGCLGAVSNTNSMVGSQAGDAVGDGGVIQFTNSSYVVRSTACSNGASVHVGAFTLASAADPTPVGPLSTSNSLAGKQFSEIGLYSTWPTFDAPANLLMLVHAAQQTISLFRQTTTSIASGSWNDPATWDAGVPGGIASVVVASGTTVTIPSPGSAPQAATAGPASYDLTNLGTVNLGSAALSIAGDFTNRGTFNAGSGSLTLQGNFNNQGVFNPGTSTVTFAGGYSQSINASAATNLYNLTLQPSARLVEVPQADLFTVQGALTNLGDIAKALPVTGAGKLTFGLTGVQIQVDTAGGLRKLEIQRYDDPNTYQGGIMGGYNINTGKAWYLSAVSSQPVYSLTLILPFDSSGKKVSPSVCNTSTKICGQSGYNTQAVWLLGVSQITDNWAVGLPVLQIFAPIIKR